MAASRTKLSVLTVGKLRDQDILGLCQGYTKRMSPKPLFKDVKKSAASAPTTIKMQEGEAVLAQCHDDDFIVVLDERGQNLSSPQWAKKLDQQCWSLGKSLVVIIGGAYGLSDAVRQRADMVISFGKMTWPHQMVALMVVEQLYRAQMILSGHPYHKE